MVKSNLDPLNMIAAGNGVRELLRHIEPETWTRPGLKDTPDRVVRSYLELFAGYKMDPAKVLKEFEGETYDGIVLIKQIEFTSTCEHHLLPFYGTAHIAYIPSRDKVVGASKLPRLLEVYARRLQIQERIGRQVVDALMEHLKPKGAACLLEARHHCMCARGVGKQHSVMSTSSLAGAFRDDAGTRAELMAMIKG